MQDEQIFRKVQTAIIQQSLRSLVASCHMSNWEKMEHSRLMTLLYVYMNQEREYLIEKKHEVVVENFYSQMMNRLSDENSKLKEQVVRLEKNEVLNAVDNTKLKKKIRTLELENDHLNVRLSLS